MKATMLLLVALGAAGACTAQQEGVWGSVDRFRKAARQVQVCAYTYRMELRYPDGRKQDMTGHVAVDMQAGQFYHQNDKQVILLTKDWYYYANHNEKTVTVAKVTGKDKPDIFNQASSAVPMVFEMFMDSVLKQGKLQQYTTANGKTTAAFDFAEGEQLRHFDLVLNDKNGLPESVGFVYRIPWGMNAQGSKPAFLEQQVTCTGYQYTRGALSFDTGKLFAENGKTIVLKENKTYKINYIK